jgi:DNA replication protein DnaC
MTNLDMWIGDTSSAEYKIRRRVSNSGLPEARRGLTWDDIDRDRLRAAAIDDARAWAGGRIAGLFLEGGVGTGKTTIAVASANHFLENTGRLHWANAAALVAQLSALIGTEQREHALTVVTDTAALVLDDLDKTRPSAYAAEQLFLAIETRIAHGAPLLITSNLALREIAERYEAPLGEAIASRLAGYCKRHRVTGTDRRTAASTA